MNRLGKMMEHVKVCNDVHTCNKCKYFFESFILKCRHCGDAY